MLIIVAGGVRLLDAEPGRGHGRSVKRRDISNPAQATAQFDPGQSPDQGAQACFLHHRRISHMPTDSLLVAIFVVAMFVVFAAVLFWGDRQTRPKQLADSSHGKRRAF